MNRVEGWGINWSFSLFLLITAGCTLKYKNENFEYFCRQIQNHGKSTKSIKIDSKSIKINSSVVGVHDAFHLPHLAESFLYYVVQVVNSQRGHNAAIALLHRRSGGHRRGPGQYELANNPKVGKGVKFRQIIYFSRKITEFYI